MVGLKFVCEEGIDSSGMIEKAIQLHIEDIKASGLPVPQAVSSMATVEVAVN